MIRMIQGFDELAESQDELVATAATIAVVGAGVIIFEAALLPGLVLGIATMLVPKYLPRLHPNPQRVRRCPWRDAPGARIIGWLTRRP